MASLQLDARAHGVALATVDLKITLAAVASILGTNVDYARGSIAISRGQYTVGQADRLDEVSIQKLIERRIGIQIERQQNSVYLILDTQMLAANMNFLVLIEGDAGHL